MSTETPSHGVQLVFGNGREIDDLDSDVIVLNPRRLTVEDYHRMGEAGILGEDDRVELIEGELIQMSPIGILHAACVDTLTEILVLKLQGRYLVRIQGPTILDTHSEPQPDALVLLPKGNRYRGGHPAPPDVVAVFEVSDTSLAYDRRVKLPLYASRGIPEAWIVDIQHQRLERYSEPGESGYAAFARIGTGQTLASTQIPDLVLSTDELLGTSEG